MFLFHLVFGKRNNTLCFDLGTVTCVSKHRRTFPKIFVDIRVHKCAISFSANLGQNLIDHSVLWTCANCKRKALSFFQLCAQELQRERTHLQPESNASLVRLNLDVYSFRLYMWTKYGGIPSVIATLQERKKTGQYLVVLTEKKRREKVSLKDARCWKEPQRIIWSCVEATRYILFFHEQVGPKAVGPKHASHCEWLQGRCLPDGSWMTQFTPLLSLVCFVVLCSAIIIPNTQWPQHVQMYFALIWCDQLLCCCYFQRTTKLTLKSSVCSFRS